MSTALVITLASVVVGGVLAAATSRGHALLDVLRTFAVAAVATLAAVQLLPEAVESLGAWALLAFVGALALPPVFAWAWRKLTRHPERLTSHGVGVELGYFGFVAHQFVEGLALGTYSGPQHADHDHVGLVLAVAAHTVPLTALFIGTVLVRRGAKPAIRRVVALMLASGLGFVAAGWVNRSFTDTIAPLLAALVAGFLCHVLLHRHDEPEQRTPSLRVLEAIAVVAGAALPLSAIHSHGAEAHAGLQLALLDAWLELALETAPMLLLGLLLGAFLQVVGARMPPRWLASGSASTQALRGIAIGAPLPLCACGVLPIAEGLRKRGAGVALVVAFLVSTPELGPETLTLSVRFLGWPYALVRLVAALFVAYVAALVFARLVHGQHAHGHDHAPLVPVPEPRRPLHDALRYLDELLLHTAPWTVVGLLAAAYLAIAFPPDALAPLAQSGLDVVVVALIALPMYVCAASATPLAAVLLLKGVSPGAVLVGLLLGPATNIATVAVLARAYGSRATLIGVAAITAVVVALGYLVNAIAVPVALPHELDELHTHGVFSWGALAVLVAMLGWQLWRWGLGPWLEILDAGAHLDTHDHDHEHHHH